MNNEATHEAVNQAQNIRSESASVLNRVLPDIPDWQWVTVARNCGKSAMFTAWLKWKMDKEKHERLTSERQSLPIPLSEEGSQEALRRTGYYAGPERSEARATTVPAVEGKDE